MVCDMGHDSKHIATITVMLVLRMMLHQGSHRISRFHFACIIVERGSVSVLSEKLISLLNKHKCGRGKTWGLEVMSHQNDDPAMEA
jgi:hypothetical protein